jgi:ribosome recycling factor
MSQDVSKILKDAEVSMDKAIEHLKGELAKVRAGKANPQMLEGVYVDYYGTPTPLAQVGAINTPDPRTLVIQPWEKNMLQPIEKAIINSNLGLNPQNDGNVIRLSIPVLTEERRKQLVKMSKQEAEHSRVAIRSIRKETNEAIRKEIKNGLPEDEGKRAEDKVQQLTDKHIAKVEETLQQKEKEIMTV